MAALFVFVLGCGEEDQKPVVAPGVGEIRVAAVDAYYNPGQPITTIEARFAAQGLTSECTTTAYGGCTVVDCSDATDTALSSAGTLTVSTTDERVQEDVDANATGAYVFGENALLFADGDTLTVAGSGGDVPSFSIDAPFPPTLAAVEPLLTASENTLPIGDQEDTTVRVSGGTPGVEFQAELRSAQRTMRCTAPAESGELVLSAEALDATGGGVIELRASTRTWARAGNFDVTVTLLSGVMQEERLLVLTTN
jgi:hypothetical protein